MIAKIAFCQTSSDNGFPKTVTGVVDFGKEHFTVFTQQQKEKMVLAIVRLDDCEVNAIRDSAIIAEYQNKTVIDSLALDICIEKNQSLTKMVALSQHEVKIKESELDIAKAELESANKREARQKRLKKVGIGLGTSLGTAVGAVGGYFVGKWTEKLGL